MVFACLPHDRPAALRRGRPCRSRWPLVTLLGLFAAEASAVSLPELESHPKLTPKRFAAYFESFDYEVRREVQPAELFLARRKGDCDDYAVLADQVLRPHGYQTRLIHVRLAGMIAHAVCYVHEDKAYLDYNNRAVFFTLTRAKPSLRDIARKVADSLEANWTSASEFVYSPETNRKTIVATVVRTAPPDEDPPLGASPAPSRIQVE